MILEFLRRLKEMIEEEGVSVRNFEMNCGITNGTISRTLKNNKSFQIQVLLKISDKYPHWNMNYLIAGSLPEFFNEVELGASLNNNHSGIKPSSDFLMSVVELGEAVKKMAESIQQTDIKNIDEKQKSRSLI